MASLSKPSKSTGNAPRSDSRGAVEVIPHLPLFVLHYIKTSDSQHFSLHTNYHLSRC